MRSHVVVGLVALGILAAGFAYAGDWSQWRGPLRNGVAPQSPPLIDAFPEGGPKRVWENDAVPGHNAGGYGCVSVSGDRACVFVHHRYDEPIEKRVLTGNALIQLGWVTDMPAELSAAVETARVSEERTNLKDWRKLNAWLNEWVKANVKQEHRRFQGAAQARLRAGKDAVAFDLLPKLDTIKDKEFAGQAELDAWFAANAVDDANMKLIMKVIPTTQRAARDLVYGLDARTGTTVWKKEMPGEWMWYPASTTPCISGGRCYVLSSEAHVHCYDLADGTEIWKSKLLGAERNWHNRSSSILLAEGLVVVLTESALSALDAATGEVVWTQKKVRGEEASAVPWTADGKTCIILHAEKTVYCLELKTGEVVWTAPGGVEAGSSTPVIDGDVMVFCGGDDKLGLTAYRLSPEKAEPLWNVPFKERHASPVIHDGYVYAIGGANATYGDREKGRVLCVELKTGKVAWDEVIGRGPELSSPVIADGKLIAVVGTSLYLIKADPAGYRLLGKADLRLAPWASPAFSDGKLYLRGVKGVVCCDLTRP